MRQINYDHVSAMRPEYTQNKGDCTEIIYENGETYIAEKNISSVINTMGKYYCTDLKANRKVYGKLLRIKNNVPIVFSDKHILVPYKVRKPLNKRDGAYGYFNLYHLTGFEGKGKNAFIKLRNGIKLKLFQNLKPYLKHITLAERLFTEKR
ncbi:MAG: competence protein ComK [Dethiosulfatibacter sp.]|nr:competence protein ComK [Dethiosulfatibacter sp.]